MKKVYSIAGVFLLATVLVFGGNVLADDTGGAEQANEQAQTGGSGDNGGGQEAAPALIDGENDQRLINNNMNYRERVEMQRAIQKRAAAQRNALIQAEAQKQAQQNK